MLRPASEHVVQEDGRVKGLASWLDGLAFGFFGCGTHNPCECHATQESRRIDEGSRCCFLKSQIQIQTPYVNTMEKAHEAKNEARGVFFKKTTPL